MNDTNLASEILSELKIQGRRWATAFFIVLTLWAATIAGFIWYLNQYDFVSYSQDGEGYNYINNRVEGDVTNGTNTPTENEEVYSKGNSGAPQ